MGRVGVELESLLRRAPVHVDEASIRPKLSGQTILVTYYNAPDADKLREHYEDLPAKLRAEAIDPAIPWLYGFQLDFRFR